MSASLKDRKDMLIALIGAVIVVSGLTYFIIAAIKKNKAAAAQQLVKSFPEPSNVITTMSLKPNAATYFSVFDTVGNVINDLGVSIAHTIVNELWATLYTSDATVNAAFAQLKTKGDFATIQEYIDQTIIPMEHPDSDNLITRMAKELSTATNASILEMINKLPLTI